MVKKKKSIQDQLRKCVQCGSCLPICPVYRIIEEEDVSPRGKVFFIKMQEVFPEQLDEELEDEFADALFSCVCCSRCTEICDSDVEVMELFKETRGSYVDKRPELCQIISNIRDEKNVYGLDNSIRAEGWLFDLLSELPDIADYIYPAKKKADVVFFVGCLMSFRGRHSSVIQAIIKILKLLKIDFLLLGGEEYCCGHPLDLLGKSKEAQQIRVHNSQLFKETEAEVIITDCPGCLEGLREEHPLPENIRVLHVTEFFDEQINTVPNKLDITLKYHDPCELFRNNEVTKAPRSLLKKMGVEVVEMEPACCGGGGMARVSKEKLSSQIMEERIKVEKLEQEPIEVVTCCPSCLEQYELAGITTWDIAEWLVKALTIKEE
ncbi:MAG: (Fe-S)-binding protein [Asgard group archaeon]|nr:(Fe-S)-binding protein [Asgard group archaeon]